MADLYGSFPLVEYAYRYGDAFSFMHTLNGQLLSKRILVTGPMVTVAMIPVKVGRIMVHM